jgi:hypothetical protein
MGGQPPIQGCAEPTAKGRLFHRPRPWRAGHDSNLGRASAHPTALACLAITDPQSRPIYPLPTTRVNLETESLTTGQE